MAFLCQRQSYLKSLTTKVLECQPCKMKGKDLFRTILQESVFFPEGGGQPCDFGTINDAKVEYVAREKAQAVIYCDKLLEIGSQANCILDWERRFDHMQQHSAQHILSAVLENKYGINTTSWELGTDSCNIELDTSSSRLTDEIKKNAQDDVNDHIRNCVPVTVKCLNKVEANELIKSLSRRGIPEDIAEPVRIIQIEGLDANMCCGTHVENLAHVQCLHLLHDISTRGVTRLYFLAGNRIFQRFKTCLQREQSITSLLNNGPPQHCEIIENMKRNQKKSESELKYAIREIATLDMTGIEEKLKEKKMVLIHREFSDMLYISATSSQVLNLLKNNPDKLVLLTSGGPKGLGMFCGLGSTEMLKKIEPLVVATLEGKGSVVKGRLQGKANKIENYKKLFTEIEKMEL